MATFGPPPPLTHDDLVNLLRRNFDDSWLDPLLQDPSSASLFEAFIAMALRVQTAIDQNFSLGSFILTAPGPAPATSTIRIQRPSGGSGTIPATLQIRDQRGGMWHPAADVAVPSSGGTQTLTIPITTYRQGYYLNSFEPLSYSFVDRPFDPHFVVLPGTDPATGGTSGFLDLIGQERACPRATGESSDQYRTRMLLLPDQVSPDALSQVILAAFDAIPALTQYLADLVTISGYRPIREPFVDSGQPSSIAFAGGGLSFWDDLFLDDVHGQQLRSIRDSLAWLDVQLPIIPDPFEIRLFWSDGFFDDPLMGFLDAPPSAQFLTFISTLASQLDNVRADGVGVRILYGVPIELDKHPPGTQHGGSVTPGNWVAGGTDGPVDLIAAVQSAIGDRAYASTSTATGPGSTVISGDASFGFVAPPTAPSSVSYVRLVAWLKSVPAGGTVPVFQFTWGGVRAGQPVSVQFDQWRRVEMILEQNPSTAVPWTPGAIAGYSAGFANVATAGATDELRVGEFYVGIVAGYGG